VARRELRVRIGDARGERIEIYPLARSGAGDRLVSNVVLRAGGFTAGFSANLAGRDLARFREGLAELRRRVEGRAAFAIPEAPLAFALTGDSRGRIEVEGAARDRLRGGNRLAFSFRIDQTYLPRILADLDEALAAFPVP